MGTKNTDEVRCINKKTGKVKFFRKWFANDKNWQKSTGFTPEELPKVKFVNGETDPDYSIDKVVAVVYESQQPDEPETEFNQDFITTEDEPVDTVTVEKKEQSVSTKPKGKKATKPTTK